MKFGQGVAEELLVVYIDNIIFFFTRHGGHLRGISSSLFVVGIA